MDRSRYGSESVIAVNYIAVIELQSSEVLAGVFDLLRGVLLAALPHGADESQGKGGADVEEGTHVAQGASVPFVLRVEDVSDGQKAAVRG
jgi:hypothetical protein